MQRKPRSWSFSGPVAGFELKRHQQFTPLARQGFTAAHLVGVEAAGQLLREGAAAFQHPSAEQIGGQRPGCAHGIDARMPPEAVVFTGEQGSHQVRWVALEAGLLLMLL